MACLLAFAVNAQEDSISVSTKVINVSVSVTDKKGETVTGLAKGDFELYENNKKTDIAFFSTQDAPVSFGIVYDLHPIFSRQTNAVLRSLESFTRGLGTDEDFFLTVFNEYGSLNINFVPTEEQIRRHLSFGERNEPNSLYDAIYFAGNKLRERTNQKKTLIVISDAKDHQSDHGFKELQRLFDSFSVQIYTVILDDKDSWDFGDLSMGERVKRLDIDDSELDKAAIRELSAASGGGATSPRSGNAVDLYRIFENIAVETRRRYSLGFYPAEGDTHKVLVKVIRPNGGKLDLNYQKTYRLRED
ncbi:MAG: VWA domain-containing protein [Acidobacteriota bacterium]|nr:VWA domain-containing protein [Acidobacteriota bacterium]MDH3528557.1 VWA domain-containing protein [Acidobacteriota bacterium]